MFLFYITIFLTSINAQTITLERELELGDESLSTNDLPTAITHYRQGIELFQEMPPDDKHTEENLIFALSLYTNLGTTHSTMGNDEMAIQSYEQAINLHQHHHQSRTTPTSKTKQKEINDIVAQSSFFLAMTYHELNRISDAIRHYQLSHSLDPKHWSSYANLGSVYYDVLQHHSKALECYNEAFDILTTSSSSSSSPTDTITDPPSNDEAHLILSELQYRIGLALLSSSQDDDDIILEQPKKERKNKCVIPGKEKVVEVSCREMAASSFHKALEYHPENEKARHMLSSVTADATMKRASNAYVTDLFDAYAPNFEHSLVEELGYDGYSRLRRVFDRTYGGSDKVPIFGNVVDAGCGTGLVGEQFRNISQHLIGADLSAAIINQAIIKRPNLYDETVVGDVMELFRSSRKYISLIIAADSYIYFGDLVPLFDAMREGLVGGGVAAFTLENVSVDDEKSLDETKPDWRWQLTPSGRFAHRREYVELVARDHDFVMLRYEPLERFRVEKGVGVRGHVFVMQKREESGGGGDDEF